MFGYPDSHNNLRHGSNGFRGVDVLRFDHSRRLAGDGPHREEPHIRFFGRGDRSHRTHAISLVDLSVRTKTTFARS